MGWSRRKPGQNSSLKWHEPTCPTTSQTIAQQSTQAETTTTETTTEAVLRKQAEVREQQTVTTTTQQSGGLEALIASAVLPHIESKISGLVDESKVEAIVNRLFDGMIFKHVTTVEVKTVEGVTKDCGVQHKQFALLLQLVQARVNVWLPGPAGSGKTTACENAAKKLEMKFFHCGAMDNDYKLMGFINAQGQVVNTLFREWFINGGVFCGDEIDSWLPSATLALNSALANGHCTFPDGTFQRHPDAIFIGCANTWGLGATNDYVGRMKQDAAFLDRFVKLDWPYDEGLELALTGNDDWCKRVQALRAKAKDKGLKVIISPRASLNGAKLLAHGMPQNVVEQVTIRQAMTDEQWRSIQ